MNNKATIKALSIAIISLLSLIKTEDSLPKKCLDSDRGKDCSSETKRDVCGYFNETIKCIKAPCGQSFTSACAACSDSRVIEVKDLDCNNQSVSSNDNNNNQTPEESAQYICTEKDRSAEVCSQEYTPVCGYKQKETCSSDENCQKGFSNNCSACIDKSIIYTYSGECPVPYIEFSVCVYLDDGSNNVEDCGKVKAEDYCGFTACESKDGCPQDFSSSCAACAGKGIVYTSKGKCADINKENLKLQYLAQTSGAVDDGKESNSDFIKNVTKTNTNNSTWYKISLINVVLFLVALYSC